MTFHFFYQINKKNQKNNLYRDGQSKTFFIKITIVNKSIEMIIIYSVISVLYKREQTIQFAACSATSTQLNDDIII